MTPDPKYHRQLVTLSLRQLGQGAGIHMVVDANDNVGQRRILASQCDEAGLVFTPLARSSVSSMQWHTRDQSTHMVAVGKLPCR